MSDLNDFMAVATMTLYDDGHGNEHYKETIVLTNIASFVDAMKKIEDYAGKDLESVNITLYDSPFLTLDDDTLNKIIERGSRLMP